MRDRGPCLDFLEGKNLNLRVMEKEDLPLLAEWFSNPEVFGEYNPIRQLSRVETEKMLESPLELKPFMIEKKDGTKIGFIAHFHVLHPIPPTPTPIRPRRLAAPQVVVTQ